MRRVTKSVTLFFATLFCATTTLAQETLTWQQCVDLAAKNNNNLKSAIATERSTHYQNNASVSGFLPQATATLNSNRGNNGNSTNPALTTVQSNVTQAYTGSVSVTQNIFNGFADVGKFDQTKANNMVSQANVAIAKAQISYDLKYAFANLSYAKESVELLDKIIKRRQDNLRIIELRYKNGMENKGSLLLAKAYLEQANLNRLQGTNLILSARAQLCKALGMSDCKDLDISDSVPTKKPTSHENIAFNQIVEKTPQHLQAVAQEQAAKAGILIARATFMPSLNVTATQGQRGTTLFPQNDYWSVGMNLTFPFFTGGKDYYTTRSAYAINSAAKENRENIDQQILVNLKQNYNSYVEAVTKLKVDSNFKEAASLRAEIARNKYNNGLLIFENWDVIETDFINRQTAYLQSKLNRIIAEAAWEQVQGQGVFSQ